MIDLEINVEYPIGVPIDMELHGVHGSRRTKFTIMTSSRLIFHDCRFEGFGSLFSTLNGEIITNVMFFRIQP